MWPCDAQWAYRADAVLIQVKAGSNPAILAAQHDQRSFELSGTVTP